MFLGLTIGVLVVVMITSLTVSGVDFIVMGAWKKLTGSVGCGDPVDGATTCCWNEENTDTGSQRTACQTCTSNGCETTYGDESTPPRPPGPGCPKFGDIQFCDTVPTPGPAAQDKPKGGIFQGDVVPTPGPAAQDAPSTQGGPAQGGIFQPIPQGPAAQDMPRGGIFQGNLLELYSQPGLVQSDPDSETPPETNTTQPGGILREDLVQLGATQDNETTSEGNMTALPPTTEETQPTTTEEKSVPQDCSVGQVIDEETGLCVPIECPEGRILDEESGLCVLEEPQAAEQSEEEPQGDEQPEDENQGSENNGSGEGGDEEASD